MKKLDFDFNPRKFIQALVFFSKNGVSDLTKMKVAKLLFLADKLHLVRYGRPITGDDYFAMQYGPVPSGAKNFLDAAEETMVSVGPDETAGLFDGYVKMVPTSYLPVITATGPDDFRVFSRSERKILDEVLKKFGGLTAAKLSDLTHKDRAYVIPNNTRPEFGRAEMPYELFFEGQDKSMLAVAEAEQEHRDMVGALS